VALPHRDWRQAALGSAFLIALFTEMFGIPFTIYLLSGVFGLSIGLDGSEGHLWAVFLDRMQWAPLAVGVPLLKWGGSAVVVTGLVLMGWGWWHVHRARGALVTGGAGFIGRHVVGELLDRGVAVRVLDDLSRARPGSLAAFSGRPGYLGLTQGDVALVSDAGMPTLADPGHEIVRAALAEGLRVEVLPGPDALTTALVGSGLPSDAIVISVISVK